MVGLRWTEGLGQGGPLSFFRKYLQSIAGVWLPTPPRAAPELCTASRYWGCTEATEHQRVGKGSQAASQASRATGMTWHVGLRAVCRRFMCRRRLLVQEYRCRAVVSNYLGRIIDSVKSETQISNREQKTFQRRSPTEAFLLHQCLHIAGDGEAPFETLKKLCFASVLPLHPTVLKALTMARPWRMW